MPSDPEATGAPPVVRAEAGVERLDLGDGAWIDVVRGFLTAPDVVYSAAEAGAAWRQGHVFRYERRIDEPRLGAWYPLGRPALHPALLDAQRWLTHRYRVSFEGYALAWYRDGRDRVAFHRDRELRHLEDTLIAVLTLGARRPWLIRPRAHRHRHDLPDGGAVADLSPASGDLVVMGGRCQAVYEHAVPEVPGLRAGRISVQWRWTSRRGRPEVGASYRAPRTFSR